jgi:beta-lactamase superfamily II metal-dependent hydrolase
MLGRALLLLTLSCGLSLAAPKTLDFYFIDVEGGQATLIVSPSGQSMLIDAGWPGFNGRDADRIVAAAKQAGLTKIDYLLVTHFHTDHAGGIPQLVEKFPVGTFVDHGDSMEHDANGEKLFKSYLGATAKGKRIHVKAGDAVPLSGVNVRVLSAGGELISKPLPGAGEKNGLCGSDERRPEDTTENARSVGTLFTFGKFRAIDLGDLTWNKEQDLVCPVNRVGKVDLYIVSHHGMDMSGSSTLVHALAARVAVMDNGARKGGAVPAYQAIKKSPGLEDIWQLHYAVAGGDGNNTSEKQTANMQEKPDEGYGIKVSAKQDGSFTVTNLRNNFSKTY